MELCWLREREKQKRIPEICLIFVLVADVEQPSSDTLERLRNISKMFSGKDDGQQELQRVEKISPSEKIKRTFRK